MIIKEIRISDFLVFAGEQVLQLPTGKDSNLVVVLAANNTGICRFELKPPLIDSLRDIGQHFAQMRLGCVSTFRLLQADGHVEREAPIFCGIRRALFPVMAERGMADLGGDEVLFSGRIPIGCKPESPARLFMNACHGLPLVNRLSPLRLGTVLAMHNICITHAASQHGFTSFDKTLKYIDTQWFYRIYEEIGPCRKSRLSKDGFDSRARYHSPQ